MTAKAALNKPYLWMIDSGSFMTISPALEDFESYEQINDDNASVKAIEGQLLKIAGKGTIRLPSNVENRTDNLVLINALHVSQADGRLLSVARLTGDGYIFFSIRQYVRSLKRTERRLFRFP